MPDPPVIEHLADYTLAQAVAAGDPEARRRFTGEYGERILQTVYIWCKPFCNRDCNLRRAGIRKLMGAFLKQDCEQVSKSYAFLLDQIENNVLRRYRGQAALSGYLYSVLHPKGDFFHKYRIEFVRFEKGKVVLPVWANDLPAADRETLKALMQGCSVEDIARKLDTGVELALVSVERLRKAAIQAGWGSYWRYFIRVHGVETQMPVSRADPDEEVPDTWEPPDTNSTSPEAAAIRESENERLRRGLADLLPLERVVLRLRYEEDLTVSEVSRGLD